MIFKGFFIKVFLFFLKSVKSYKKVLTNISSGCKMGIDERRKTMEEKDIEYIKAVLLKELNQKKTEFETTKEIDLVEEIEYLKDLLERL